MLGRNSFGEVKNKMKVLIHLHDMSLTQLTDGYVVPYLRIHFSKDRNGEIRCYK